MKHVLILLRLFLFAWYASTTLGAAMPSRTHSPLILIDSERLAQARERCASGDIALKPAYDRLLREAEAALKAGPFSVMDKTRIPRGFDKHDYFSIGPYWWPNPATPDGLPYLNKDGQINPDRLSAAFDYDRMCKMAEALDTLALAYHFTGQERYAEHAAALLRAWFLDPALRMNPNMNGAQLNPGRSKITGTGIIDLRPMHGLPDSILLLGGSRSLTDADRQGLKEWYGQFLDWLLTSEKGKLEAKAKNNHGTWYDVEAVTIALFVGRPEVARRIAEDARQRRIASQIQPDGSQPEELRRTRSFFYTLYNLQAHFNLAAAAARAGVDLWHYATPDGRSLRQALNYVLPYADPANKWPAKEITGYHTTDLYPWMLWAGVVYGDQELLRRADALAGEEQKSDRIRLLLNQ